MKYKEVIHKGFKFWLVDEIDATPLEVVIDLLDAGALKQFERWTHSFCPKNPYHPGNCFHATPALLCDLIKAKHAAGWELVVGTFTQPYHGTWLHCWLEFGDLALNCANAKIRPIYLVDKQKFYEVNNTEDIERFAPGFVKRIWDRRKKFVGTPEFNKVSNLSKEWKHGRT